MQPMLDVPNDGIETISLAANHNCQRAAQDRKMRLHLRRLSGAHSRVRTMGIENNHKLIVNCLPLTESEKAQFTRAARGVPQEFVGDSTQRGSMNWSARIPKEFRASVTAIIGNVPPEECSQCPRLEWLQTWSAGVDKYQRPGVLQPGSMLTNASGAYGQSVSEHMFAMMWALMKNLHVYACNQANADWTDAGRALSPSARGQRATGCRPRRDRT